MKTIEAGVQTEGWQGQEFDVEPEGEASADRAALHAQLQAALAWGPSYEGDMASHLPMALHAAWALGTGPEHLRHLAQSLQRKLQAAASPSPADLAWAQEATARGGEFWQARLGEHAAYPAYCVYFERLLGGLVGADDITHPQVADLMRHHLPRLLQGWHAFAFHGLIRTAHAWEARHAPELAAALATWAAWWEPLPALAEGQARGTLGQEAEDDAAAIAHWARTLRQQGQAWHSGADMIAKRLREAFNSQALSACMEAAPRRMEVQALHRHALRLAGEAYVASGNFTVLHLVTGLRAWGLLWPMAGLAADDGESVHGLRVGVAAGWLASGVARRQLPSATEGAQAVLAWADLKCCALHQAEEHGLKGVHAAFALAQCARRKGASEDAELWAGVATRVLERRAV